MNIPIYRAKKIDSNEYVEGFLFKDTDGYFRITTGIKDYKHPFKLPFEYLIDAATLAIHFHDMIDSQGNKIFASLSEDGKGGDICDINVIDAFLEKNYNIKCPILMTQKGLKPMEYLGFANFKIIKTIGIQE